MNTMFKRVLSLVLTLCMVAGMIWLPSKHNHAHAEEAGETVTPAGKNPVGDTVIADFGFTDGFDTSSTTGWQQWNAGEIDYVAPSKVAVLKNETAADDALMTKYTETEIDNLGWNNGYFARGYYWGMEYTFDAKMDGAGMAITIAQTIYGTNSSGANDSSNTHSGRYVNAMIGPDGKIYDDCSDTANVIGQIDTEKYDLTEWHTYRLLMIKTTQYSGNYRLWIQIDGEVVPYDGENTIISDNGATKDYFTVYSRGGAGTLELDNMKIIAANFSGNYSTGDKTISAIDYTKTISYNTAKGDPITLWSDDFESGEIEVSETNWSIGKTAGGSITIGDRYENNTGFIRFWNGSSNGGRYHNSPLLDKMIPNDAISYFSFDANLSGNGALQFRLGLLRTDTSSVTGICARNLQYAIRAAVGDMKAGIYNRAATSGEPLIDLSSLDMTKWHSYTFKTDVWNGNSYPLVTLYVDGVEMGSFQMDGTHSNNGGYHTTTTVDGETLYYGTFDQYRNRIQLTVNTAGYNLGLTGYVELDNIQLSYDAWTAEQGMTYEADEEGKVTVTWDASAYEEWKTNVTTAATATTLEEAYTHGPTTYNVYVNGVLKAENTSATTYTLEDAMTCASEAVTVKVIPYGAFESSEGLTTTIKLEHTAAEAVQENVVAADCENAGSYDEVVYCSACNAELSRETKTVDALGHTEGEVEIENETFSTCETAGTYDEVVYCSVCGEELSRTQKTKELAACIPGEVEIENETDSTCEVAGTYDEVVYCTVCGEEISRTTKNKELAEHTPGEAYYTYGSDNGKHIKIVDCSACGTNLSRTEENCSGGTATCTDPATCQFCELNYGDTLDHTPATPVRENETESTCEVAGTYDEVVYCSVCGEEISRTQKTKELAKHTEADPVIENETNSTCETAGTYDEVVYCSVCGEELSRTTKTKELAACIPGEVEIENETDSTCETAGTYDEVVYCSVCGEELSRTTKTKALAEHTEQPAAELEGSRIEATLNAPGSYIMVVTCADCGVELSRETVVIPQLTGAAAEIDGTYYATLQEALDAAEDHDVVVLLKNIEVSKYLDVYTPNNGEVARSFTLDLNGYTISPAADYKYSDYALLFIGLNQSVTITGNGTITAAKYTTVGVYGKLTLENATIISTGTTDEDAAVDIYYFEGNDAYPSEAWGTGVINGGTISGKLWAGGNVTITGGVIDVVEVYDDTATINGGEIGEIIATVQIGNTYYADLQSAIDAAEAGNTITLLANVEVTSSVTINKNITLDIGEFNITRTAEGDGNKPAILVTGATAKITGTTGTVTAVGGPAVWAFSGNVTIDGGNYIGTNHSVYASGTSAVVIENGKFSNTSDDQYAYVLNILDADRATCTINVYGGEFVNFDPANNGAEGTGTNFLADKTKHTMQTNGVYTICECAAKAPVEEGRVEASCTEAGSYDMVTYCECGKELSRETFAIEATGHTSSKVEVHSATCTVDGYLLITCNGCGETFDSREEGFAKDYLNGPLGQFYDLSAKGHTAGEAVEENRVEATLNAPGSYEMVVYCSVCGEELSRESFEIAQLTGAAASVDGIFYATLQEAIDAADGKTVVVLKDIELTEGLTVAAGKVVTIDLNGKIISGVQNAATSSAVLTNKGTLTITDSIGTGKITCFAVNPDLNQDIPSYANNTINNYGVLTIEGGTIENSTVAGKACFPIDCYQGSVLNITGGTITGRGAIRVFAQNNNIVVNISGGSVLGTSYAIWVQNPSNENATDVMAELNITGGTVDRILIDCSANFNIAISGGTIKTVEYWEIDETDTSRNPAGFITGGTFAADVSEFLAEGLHLVENEGIYTICTAAAKAPVEENRVAADCENAGSYDMVTYCECGKELSRETITVEATGHRFSGLVVHGGTCTEYGYIEIDCGNCGGHYVSGVDAEADEYLAEYSWMINVAPTGHTAGETVIEGETESTCTVAGTYDEVVYCSVCGEELSRTTVTKELADHTWTDENDEECDICGLNRFVTPSITVEEGIIKTNGSLKDDWRIGIFYIGENAIPEDLTSGAAWNNLVAYGKQYPSINGANGYKSYFNGTGLPTLEQGGNWVLYLKYPTEVEGETVYKTKFISYVAPGEVVKEFEAPTVEINDAKEIVLTNSEYITKLYVFYVGEFERAEYISAEAWTALVKEGKKYPAINGANGYQVTTDMNALPELTEAGNYVFFVKYTEDGKTKTVVTVDTIEGEAAPAYHTPEATIVDGEIVLNFHEDDTFQKVYLFYTGETTFTDTTSAAAWTALVREGKKYDINGANGYQVTTDPENLPAATEAGQYYVFVRYTDVNDATRTVVVPVVVE